MENASKALVIAGAILISIILIGIGMMVVNSVWDIFGTGQSSIDEQAVTSFNSKFLSYEGNQKGSSVRTLMGVVSTSNAADDNAERQVAVEGPNNEKDPDTLRAAIKTTSTYHITFTTDTKTGYISKITVAAGAQNP